MAIYHHQLGNWAFADGQYSEAEQYFQKASAAYPNQPLILTQLGDTLSKQGHPVKAIAFYKQALAVDPAFIPAVTRQGKAEWQIGNRILGITRYEDALEKKQSDYAFVARYLGTYLAMAQAFGTQPVIENANLFAKALMDQHPQLDEALRYDVAKTLFETNQATAALDLYCDLARRHPNNAETHYSLAVLLAKNHAYSEASKQMKTAVELVGEHQPPLRNNGRQPLLLSSKKKKATPNPVKNSNKRFSAAFT